MDSTRKAALVAGICYLLTFVGSIPAWFLQEPLLTNPDYVIGAGADTRIIAGSFLDLVTAFAGIGTAVALYSVVRRQHEGLALGFVTTRVMEGAIIVVSTVALLAVVGIRTEGATGAEATALTALQGALVKVRDWTFLFGPGLMPVLNALLLGTLMYRSGLVPRIIPTVGLIGAPILFASTIGTMFGVNDTQSAFTGLATMPIFFWELSVGLYMTFKGFRADAPLLTDAARATTAQPAMATGGAA
ncbi:MAG TPA: DUF4386 domain-containing protein [Candidatus Limnocylindria bacterium]|nr:DUF4386 domain-containing protein [Candidatus Limnocylindria bacterium]